MTAAELLSALKAAGCQPHVDDFDLVLEIDPPGDLGPRVDILQTGLRALLSGRRWHGVDSATGRFVGPYPRRGSGPLANGALDPTALLPPTVGLLSVAGDPNWDRLSPFARLDCPDLFVTPVATRPSGR